MEEQSAAWLIQKIFTGQQQDSLVSSWTDIESGFFEYLTCRVLATVSPFLQNCRLVLQSVEREVQSLQEWLSKQSPAVELVFSAKTEVGLLSASLLLPDQVLGETRGSTDFLQHAGWIGGLLYSFSVHVGVASLSSEQFDLLEEGDVILLDRSTVALDPAGLQGTVELRCRRLRRGVIRGSLLCAGDGKAKITVEGLAQEGLEPMTDANKKSEGAVEAGTPEVLSSVEIPVVVEFARLNFTLQELSAFKEGQVVELEKSRPELVDLSVEGRIVANGKLVDVEGKLGVQIGKILKGKSKEQ
jgi:type III secretion system YscQ/HrcQ family protein